MSDFNARRARAKRPCPLWVDAFQRDTQHLEADEVGAYMLILMAMWTRESCDFPNDPRRLAKVARVSTRLWKSRIGPVLLPLLSTAGDVLISKRLREEASYVEDQLTRQSDRKRSTYAKPVVTQLRNDETGEKSANGLINKEVDPTADQPRTHPRTHPRHHPSQQPNNPTYNIPPPLSKGGTVEGDAQAASDGGGKDEPEFRERLLEAIGADPVSGAYGPNGKLMGRAWEMEIARKWISDLGLTEAEAVAQVREVMTGVDVPVSSFKYFTPAMQRLAKAKAEGIPGLNQDHRPLGDLGPVTRAYIARKQAGGGS